MPSFSQPLPQRQEEHVRPKRKVIVRYVSAKVPSHIVPKRSNHFLPGTKPTEFQPKISTVKNDFTTSRKPLKPSLRPLSQQNRISNSSVHQSLSLKRAPLKQLAATSRQKSLGENISSTYIASSPDTPELTSSNFERRLKQTPSSNSLVLSLPSTPNHIERTPTNSHDLIETSEQITQALASISLQDQHKASKAETPLIALKSEVRNILSALLLDENRPKQEREAFLRCYIERLKKKVIQPLYGKIIEEETSSTDHEQKRLFALKEVDGGFAIAYTPVRIVRKKDQAVMGSRHVITPVKRSLRHLGAYTSEEMASRGLKQVPDLHDMFQQSGYAYAPNDALL